MATGLLGGVAGWLSPLVITVAPFLYGLLLGVHVLPGIVAQEVLRMPWVALLTHVLAALVASATSPQWTLRYLGTALLFGGIQELVAALTRYRAWQAWRFFVSAVVIGVLIAVVVAMVVDIAAYPAWVAITYLVVSVLAPVAWTALGLWAGTGLRRAGVVRTARR